MVTYRMQLPQNVIVGREAVRTAAKEIRRTSGPRVLMITETELADTGAAEALRTEFEEQGLSVVFHTSIGAKSLTSAAGEAVEIGRAGHVDTVVGFGSAGTMGLSRLIASLLERGPRATSKRGVLFSTSVPDVDDVLDEQLVPTRGTPFVAVPSLPFDPLLCAPRCLVVDARNRHCRLVSLMSAPSLVLIDARFIEKTTTMQALLSAAATLLLSAEGLHSGLGNPIAATLFGRAISQVVSTLERINEAKEQWQSDEIIDLLCDIGLHASLAASSTGPGPGTAACAVLHARTGLGLTAAASVLAAPVIATLVRLFPDTATEIASHLGVHVGTLDIVETRIRELLDGVGLPLRLKDIGIDPRDVSGVSANVDSMGVLGAFGGRFGTGMVDQIIEQVV